MRKFKSKKKKNRVFISFIIILINVILILFTISKLVNDKLTDIVLSNIKTYNINLLTKYLNSSVILENNIDNLLEIVKNNKDEIIAVNYNMKDAYKLMNDIDSKIKNAQDEYLYVEHDDYADIYDNKILLKYPLGIATGSPYLYNLGTKIPIILYLNKTTVITIKSKVRNYGINNSLVELYINITIITNILAPMYQDNIENTYELPIMSKLVVGKVPSYLNGLIEKETTNDILFS